MLHEGRAMPLASEFPSVNCGSQLPLEACFVSGGQKWLLHFYTCLFFVILPILHSFLFFFGVEKVKHHGKKSEIA